MNMKGYNYIFLIFAMIGQISFGQKTSKGDQFFFEYNYKAAIQQYELESQEGPLSAQQRLNLAEAYFKSRDFKSAANRYLAIYRADSTLTGRDFNIMLQALSRSSNEALKDGSINLRTASLSGDLLDNAAFNFELLQGNLNASVGYEVKPISGNSPQDDYAPTFLEQDRMLFSSTRSSSNKEVHLPSGMAYTDIFVGRIGNEGDVSQVNSLPWLPDLKFHESTPFYSTALNGVFYVRSNTVDGELSFDESGKNTLAICLAKEDDYFMELLSTPSTSFYYPYYDEVTERLYFAADFPQGYGGTDLYFVMTSKGKIMSSPMNLGAKINTPGNEIAPFIFEGNLYFSSDVFYGLGGMDIYKSQLGMGQSFSTPINLGPGINGTSDDFGFVVRSGEYGGYEGYFASNRPSGRGGDDIYHFKVNETPGLKTLMVQGEVISSATEYGLEGASIQFLNQANTVIKETTSKGDGTFRLEIPWQENVRLVITKERFSKVVYQGEEGERIMTSGQNVLISIDPVESVVQELRGQNVLSLERFYFEKGSAQVNPEVLMVLDKAVKQLKDFPDFLISVEAHTNSLGSDTANTELSQSRAEAIRDYFISQGISAERILEVTGFGESQIVNHCVDGVFCLEVLHRQNERCPIVVLNYNE